MGILSWMYKKAKEEVKDLGQEIQKDVENIYENNKEKGKSILKKAPKVVGGVVVGAPLGIITELFFPPEKSYYDDGLSEETFDQKIERYKDSAKRGYEAFNGENEKK